MKVLSEHSRTRVCIDNSRMFFARYVSNASSSVYWAKSQHIAITSSSMDSYWHEQNSYKACSPAYEKLSGRMDRKLSIKMLSVTLIYIIRFSLCFFSLYKYYTLFFKKVKHYLKFLFLMKSSTYKRAKKCPFDAILGAKRVGFCEKWDKPQPCMFFTVY